MAKELRRSTGLRQLCLSGGVALNCVANARVLEEAGFERVWVPPCASGTGAPLGSRRRQAPQSPRPPRRLVLTHPFYGPVYSDRAFEAALAEAGLTGTRLSETELLARVARDLAEGKVVGWFQGRSEMGPRALGNRSILADPRRAEMKDAIN